MLGRLQVQIEKLGGWWCRVQHQSVRWPIYGEYQCATCYRRLPVPWAGRPQQHPSARIQRVSSGHHSVTTWAPARHDTNGSLPVF